MKCPYCKAENRGNAKFCVKCGANLQMRNSAEPENNDSNNYYDGFDGDNTQTEFYEDIVTKEQLKKAQHATRSKVILITIFSIIILGLLCIIAYLIFGSGMKFDFPGGAKEETTVTEESTQEVTEKTVAVPAVAGYDYNLALQRMSNVNLKVTYTSEYSDNVSQNCVISQTPTPEPRSKRAQRFSLLFQREEREHSQLFCQLYPLKALQAQIQAHHPPKTVQGQRILPIILLQRAVQGMSHMMM